MTISVEFSMNINATDKVFESYAHLREELRSIYFSKKYRVRTFKNEFGRITDKDIYAVSESGEEQKIGSIVN